MPAIQSGAWELTYGPLTAGCLDWDATATDVWNIETIMTGIERATTSASICSAKKRGWFCSPALRRAL